MIKYFLFFLLLIFPQNSLAQDEFLCEEEKNKILQDLMEEVTCFHDNECGYYDFGYPWQPDACIKAIINIKQTNKNIFNLQLIEDYNKNCIYNNPEEMKKFEKFSQEASLKDCDILPRLYCLKGKCRINSYSTVSDK